MPNPRVVFLSPPCGEEQLKFLRSLYCEVVYYDCYDNPPCLEEVEYDIGINYLYLAIFALLTAISLCQYRSS